MIYSSVGRSPYENDEIYLEMNPSAETSNVNGVGGFGEAEKEEEEEDRISHQLDAVIEFYNCYDLLPYVNHVFWLAAVKEAMGYIPFKLDYIDIRCLVILQEEINKKQTKDMQNSEEEHRATMSRARH